MKNKTTGIILAAVLCVCACTSETERTAATTQEQAIAAYVAAQDTATVTLVARNDSYRLIFRPGAEPAAEAGDYVYFRYVGYVFDKTKTGGKGMPFDTNIADTLGLPRQAADHGKGIVGLGRFLRGLDNGLQGMTTGEQAQILFAASQGFGNTSQGLVPPLSALLYEVEMIYIIKQ